MILLLALLLLQSATANLGAVTGSVRLANGSPAAGVRVYAVAVRSAAETDGSPPALESLTETDSSGRFRIDLPPGRYYIASGSVTSPTYYPGTTSLSDARVITVAPGEQANNIDFSSFVPANRQPGFGLTASPMPALPPGSTGEISGTIRFQNGKPAVSVPVFAVPTSLFGSTALTPAFSGIFYTFIAGTAATPPTQNVRIRRVVNGLDVVQTTTDVNGRYRLENLPPATYYILAGFSNAATFYPGSPLVTSAQSFTTTPTTKLDAMNFEVATLSAVTVNGRVTGAEGAPAGGVYVRLQASNVVVDRTLAAIGLPSPAATQNVVTDSDGRFALQNVREGQYSLQVQVPGTSMIARELQVASADIADLDFVTNAGVVHGRVLMEDGTPVVDPKVFVEAVITTVDNPNILASTLMTIEASGNFSRVTDAGKYRFHLKHLPQEYVIRSIRSGTLDLLKETLQVQDGVTREIEIRVARRDAGTLEDGGIRVSGTVLDDTGKPPAADRITLCCSASGPAERFSAPLQPDGSFEFQGLVPGAYVAGLQASPGTKPPLILGEPLELRDSATLRLRSASSLPPTNEGGLLAYLQNFSAQVGASSASTAASATITATVGLEGGTLPADVRVLVLYRHSSGMTISENISPTAASTRIVPPGQYAVTVSAPPGYITKLINGLPADSSYSLFANAQTVFPLHILLERVPPR